MLERAKEVTRNGRYTYLEYARYADDLVILVDGYRQHDWLLRAAHQRLREERASQEESFGFLGFDVRRGRSQRGVWRAQYTPKLKQRTALLRKLKERFQRLDAQPSGRVIAEINPVLRGGVAYFRIGHASRGFAFVKLWVEQKVRRHMMRARNRKGVGWTRWSTAWLHEALGLFGDYRVQYHANA
ncbi:MAG: group II intron maturase-specific domain-containing protein [Candidatus Rokuibacteriota bacterium]